MARPAVPGFGRREPGFAEMLTRSIASGGPIPLSQYMAQANAHYYATRDPLGAAGDFVTAPEISQMFGEMIGLFLADLWLRSGINREVRYVELGPGRGTLARDALRAMASARIAPAVTLVETSPVLRARQQEAVLGARFCETVEDLPRDRPLLVVANEFFDALPIRQAMRVGGSWREVMVGLDADGGLVAGGEGRLLDGEVPAALRGAEEGSIHESSPVGAAIMFNLAARLARHGGAALVIDYGYCGPVVGNTFQAVRGHEYADPFARPGDHDLTAHVDFAMLGNIARQQGLAVHGPAGQGAFLTRLGIDARAAALAAASPARAGEIAAARHRLTAPEEMGTLFKVMAVTHPDWPAPEGFAA